MAQERFHLEDLLSTLLPGRDPDVLANIAAQLDVVHLRQGEPLYEEGDLGDSMYIVVRGHLRATRALGAEQEQVALLGPGDIFGMESLLYEMPRAVSITAAVPADILQLGKEFYDSLVATDPQVEGNLRAVFESRELGLRANFAWLGVDEVIYLAVRKHIARLWISMIGPVVAVIGSLVLFYLGFLSTATTPLLFGGGLFLAAILWTMWNVVDWRNDYYVLTNQRVVWVERVAGLYSSRQEAPLRTIISVDLETDLLGRSLGYGDVVVRTYTGRIVLRHISKPQRMASLLEQYWLRFRQRTQEQESEDMVRAIRQRLDLPVEEPTQESPADEAEPEEADALSQRPGLFTLLWRITFSMRYQDGSVIIYRKHWFLLLRRFWWSTVLILLILFFIIRGLLGYSSLLSVLSTSVVGIAFLVVLSVWWLYDFVDWRNDQYQLTPDHIIDIERKPLGSAQKRSAPLDNILSLEHERRGILGLLLNFGNVRVMVGDTEFTFDGVHDPSQVHQDIFVRMDERLKMKHEQEVSRDRERMAEWLATYHRNIEGFRPEPPLESSGEKSG